jgi:GAF domain-containing protein
MRSVLLVPVLHERKVAGLLSLFSPRRDAFQEDQRWLVEQLAELLGEITYGGFHR